MQHLRAHARIAGALQDAAAAAADRIAQRRIAERELVIAVRVVLVLARIAPRLRKLPVDAGAARSRHDGRIPSNIWRPAKSWLKPRCTRSRRTRQYTIRSKLSARARVRTQ